MPDKFISSFFGRKDPIVVEPYGGFANDKHIFSKARVLEDEGIQHHEDDGVLKNIWNTYKRLESDEKRGVTVYAEWGTERVELMSDEEGYVHLDVEHGLEAEAQQNQWLPVTFRLEQGAHRFVTSTEILKPGMDVEFGVISDMDDTVIDTGVASTFKWRLLVNSIASHAHKRRPLEGVQGFYQALHQGRERWNSNPFFYVSNSPWNIHGYLNAFLQYNNFPRGPLLLRDFGMPGGSKQLEDGDKYRTILRILTAYPNMQFVLIGDAAELDADIYLRLAKNFPDRISAIFIRAVSKKKRMERVKAIIESQTDVDVKLVEDSKQAMEHARELGLVL